MADKESHKSWNLTFTKFCIILNISILFISHYFRSPIEADILISYATTPGYVSWRNSLKGSWFIQSICEVFAKNARRLDILSMLTMVSVCNGRALIFFLIMENHTMRYRAIG